LSTQKKWLRVKFKVQTKAVNKGPYFVEYHLKLTTVLPIGAPAIEGFKEHPEKLKTKWPMLKLEFPKWASYPQVPALKTVNIKNDVWAAGNLSVFNDHGKMEIAKPFMAFGAVPIMGLNMYVGSAEVFAKPTHNLNIRFNWQDLPANFGDYYGDYNEFFVSDYNTTKKKLADAGKDVSKLRLAPFFDNNSFRLNQTLLSSGEWKTAAEIAGKHQGGAYDNRNLKLFNLSYKNGNNYPVSIYRIPLGKANKRKLNAKPSLIFKPLKFSDECKDGFVRFSITGPQLGFGNDVFPKVIAKVTNDNALLLADVAAEKENVPSLKGMPNAPYIPKVSKVILDYSAEHMHNLWQKNQEVPIELFHYSPFSTALSFNSVPPPKKTIKK
jgi:hypothetical protein